MRSNDNVLTRGAGARLAGIYIYPCCDAGGWLTLRQAQDEGSFVWATRCRRLVKDYERYASTLAGLPIVAFVCLMLRHAEKLMTSE